MRNSGLEETYILWKQEVAGKSIIRRKAGEGWNETNHLHIIARFTVNIHHDHVMSTAGGTYLL